MAPSTSRGRLVVPLEGFPRGSPGALKKLARGPTRGSTRGFPRGHQRLLQGVLQGLLQRPLQTLLQRLFEMPPPEAQPQARAGSPP
eukprot:2134644-Pyramimonas_sp.AAC.1